MTDNRVRIRAELENAVSKGLGGIRQEFDQTAKSPGAQALLQGVGMGAGLTAWNALGSAVGGVTDFIGDSIRAARDQQEVVSKSGVVFGSAADDALAFGEGAAEAFGMSKTAAMDAAAGFGLFFTGAGESQEAAQDMSEKVVQLAGDLASFNNLDPTDALAKLKAGLAGEAEPLRSVGVFLTEAKVKAKAMEMGLGDAHGELTEGEKILARYQLILEETTQAQGDFARTADSNANTQRKLNAEIENLKAEVGEEFIPVEKAWLELQLLIANALTTSSKEVEHHTQMLEYLDSRGLQPSTRTYGVAITAMREHAATAAEDAAHTEMLTRKTEDLGATTGTTAAATKHYTGEASNLGTALRDLGYDVGELDKATDDLAETIADELFGDAINRGNIATIRDTIASLEDQRAETEKGSRKYRILTGEIAENRKALFDLQLQQAQEAGPEAMMKFLDDAIKRTDKADEKTLAYLESLKKLYSYLLNHSELYTIKEGKFKGKQIPGFAAGGRYEGGEPFIAGEGGHPELVIPDGPGRVVNGDQTRAMLSGGGSGLAPVELPIVIDGREIGRIIDSRLFIALDAAGGSAMVR